MPIEASCSVRRREFVSRRAVPSSSEPTAMISAVRSGEAVDMPQ